MSDNDLEKGVAVKVSLPGYLADGLQAVCNASGTSKSDITKIAIEIYLQTNPLWNNRRYFFENIDSEKIFGKNHIEKLKTFRPGAMVKLVGGLSHQPSSACFYCGVVHKISGNKLYIELPTHFYRYSRLLVNQNPIQNQIALAAEAKLSVPRIENITKLDSYNRREVPIFMYEVNSNFVWDFDIDDSNDFNTKLNEIGKLV